MNRVKTIGRYTLKILSIVLAAILAIIVCFSIWTFARERNNPETLRPANGKMAQAGDVSLFYQTAGNPENQPIILIHGMAAWSETWRQTIDVLAERGYYVIAFDMPPFGFSERPKDHSYWRQSQAARILAASKALGLKKPILVAHSYGSRGAIESVMREQSYFKGLVVIDPALNLTDTPKKPSPFVSALLATTPVRYGLVSISVTNPLLSKKLLQMFMYNKAAATPAIVSTYMLPSTLKGNTIDFGYWLQGFIGDADTGISSSKSAYKDIKLPTRIIWGKEDTTTPLSQGKDLFTLIPGSKLFVIDGVGHMPHIEKTEVFNAVLLQGLQTI